MKENLLSIDSLTVGYRTDKGTLTALKGVSLDIRKNEFLAIVGESGCGKSTLALSIIGLLPRSSEVKSGSIMYDKNNLLSLDQRQMRRFRGTEIAMIFQEPLSSLNPVYKISRQMAEAITLRNSRKHSAAQEGDVMQKAYRLDQPMGMRIPRIGRTIPSHVRDEIIHWLNMVRIADPEQILDRYPFELSGGMRQRIMIAIALSQGPSLLIADEPTTALDVTTQAQVLKLMRELMKNVNTSIALITHDLAVAAQVADRVLVMYAGEVVEDANVLDLYSEPMHPYARGLLACVPTGTKDESKINPIPGSVPDLRKSIEGCIFAPRCPYSFDRCHASAPNWLEPKVDHKVRCFLYDK